MSYSIVIPSKNATNLAACIGAIRAAGETARIIVVDDGLMLRDATGTGVDLNGFNATRWDMVLMGDGSGIAMRGMLTISGVKPFVFSRNCNLGIQAADEDDVILCNDDCLLESPMGFTHLISTLNAEPEYGCIGATTDMTGQPLQWRKDPESPKYGLRSVGHIAFVCVAIPRRTINEIGGLDERYCLDYGCEDRDYCEAIVRAGKKVGVLDDCFVNHSKLISSFRGSAAGQASFARNYGLLIQKWGKIQP